MKKVLLIYPPFCTPASPPYSITGIFSFLKLNCKEEIEVLDLNLEFHEQKLKEYQKYYKDKANWDNYNEITTKYVQSTKEIYSENNRKVVNGENPELFEELLKIIKDKKPDIVCFSIVYSSQAFYAYSLIKELKDVTTIIGGPAVNAKLISAANKNLKNELELLEFIKEEKIDHNELNFPTAQDFSIYPLDKYFTPQPVIPIKTANTCPYQGCTFCSHHTKQKYFEFPLDVMKNTIIKSKQKHFFFIDDMITKERLLKIAEILTPLDVKWTCQLKPIKDLDFKTLKILRESGLTMIMWGIESANDRILKLINKGTNKEDIKTVLINAHKAGIKNIAYILFGFPSETKEEFLETIEFLKDNKEYVDLVSSSVFGLHKGTIIYNNPAKFKIKKIIEDKRTILDVKISYEVSEGLSNKKAVKLREGHKKTLENINKYPKCMNFFREHMFCLI